MVICATTAYTCMRCACVWVSVFSHLFFSTSASLFFELTFALFVSLFPNFSTIPCLTSFWNFRSFFVLFDISLFWEKICIHKFVYTRIHKRRQCLIRNIGMHSTPWYPSVCMCVLKWKISKEKERARTSKAFEKRRGTDTCISRDCPENAMVCVVCVCTMLRVIDIVRTSPVYVYYTMYTFIVR